MRSDRVGNVTQQVFVIPKPQQTAFIGGEDGKLPQVLWPEMLLTPTAKCPVDQSCTCYAKDTECAAAINQALRTLSNEAGTLSGPHGNCK